MLVKCRRCGTQFETVDDFYCPTCDTDREGERWSQLVSPEAIDAADEFISRIKDGTLRKRKHPDAYLSENLG